MPAPVPGDLLYDAAKQGVPVSLVTDVGTLGASIDALAADIVALMTPTVTTATIGNNASLSAAVDIGPMRSIGIIMPAAWTAADLTFQVCDTLGGTYVNLYDASGTEVDIAVTTSKAYTLSAAMTRLIAPWRYLKVRSGTAGVPVAQGGARSIVIVGK